MYRVYSEYIKTNKVTYLDCFDLKEDAVKHIAKCYRIDAQICQLGEYYYYMK